MKSEENSLFNLEESIQVMHTDNMVGADPISEPLDMKADDVPFLGIVEELVQSDSMGESKNAKTETGKIDIDVDDIVFDATTAIPESVNEKSGAKVSEASSPTGSISSRSSQPSHGQRHSHRSYHQYYQSYHTPYYYPPAPYYQPPPSHGSHQSYSHHSHYYAHYPPPPGYYPPSYYYPQPSSSSSTLEESYPEKTKSTSSSYKKSSPVTCKEVSPETSKCSSEGPYTAFSSMDKKSNNSPKSQVKKSEERDPSNVKTIISSANVTSTKKRKAAPDSTIFRVSAKRNKQLAAVSKAEAAAIAEQKAKAKELEKQELSQTVIDRRSRKNAQSRMRASKLKQRIAEIQEKDPEDRTKDEIEILHIFEERRQRKNGRSRERALERKKEYERIMTIPESKWTEEEKNFVQETVVAKFKKNEGDRLRRKKLKEEVDSSASTVSTEWETVKSSVSTVKSSKSGKTKSSALSIRIPDYVNSLTSQAEDSSAFSFHHSKDAPLTPMTQKDDYALLVETPNDFFGSTIDPSIKATENFSPNFVFPSPRRHTRDFSANMDAIIDFDALELPTDGVSILDPSMAMAIDDEVMFSPHLQPPILNVHDDFNFPDMKYGEDKISKNRSKAIAVSFSVDTL